TIVLVVVVDHEVSVRAVESVADGVARTLAADPGFMIAVPVPDLEGHHLGLAADVELVRRGDRVRRLLIVVEHELAANPAHLGRMGDAYFHACVILLLAYLV